jgi:4-amino-4-deoxy-L-arabinose transferase-like glycosyltransferase
VSGWPVSGWPVSPERLPLVGLALLVVGIAALLASTLDDVGARGPDEAHYRTYMSLVDQQGAAAYGSFFSDYVDNEERWLFPNPLRLAYITLIGVTAKWLGPSFETLSWISLVAHLLCILAGYAFARRTLGDPRALLIAALIAFSPLWMALARRGLGDTLSTLAAILAIWTFWEALFERERWRWHVLFATSFAFGMLVKETAVLLAIPFAAVLAYEGIARKRRDVLLPMALALGAPVVFCGAVWWIAAGSLDLLLRLLGVILESPASNEYAIRYGGGPWFRYLLDFLLLSPLTTLLAIAAAGALVVRGRRADPAVAYLLAVGAGVLIAYGAFTKNVRYVAVLDFPIRVLTIWLVWELLRPRGARVALLASGALVILLAWADYTSFHAIFVDGGLYEAMSAPLLEFRGLLPNRVAP